MDPEVYLCDKCCSSKTSIFPRFELLIVSSYCHFVLANKWIKSLHHFILSLQYQFPFPLHSSSEVAQLLWLLYPRFKVFGSFHHAFFVAFALRCPISVHSYPRHSSCIFINTSILQSLESESLLSSLGSLGDSAATHQCTVKIFKLVASISMPVHGLKWWNGTFVWAVVWSSRYGYPVWCEFIELQRFRSQQRSENCHGEVITVIYKVVLVQHKFTYVFYNLYSSFNLPVSLWV